MRHGHGPVSYTHLDVYKRQGLPARGQRTRTNARTRKGPRKAIAGKKLSLIHI